MSVDLWILTGFLGSGKTTVLNNLLSDTGENERVGVLVNDFGDLGVDASLLTPPTTPGMRPAPADRSPSGSGAAGSGAAGSGAAGGGVEGPAAPSTIVELNGGQIFCSCLAGSFVDSLTSLVHQNVDRILVEGSGLAKPGPMREIVSEAVRATDGELRHRGTICVIDAKRFSALRSVVNAVDEQLYHADLVVVNKIDEVDDATSGTVHEQIRSVNASASVIATAFGRITLEEVAAGVAQRRTPPLDASAEAHASSRPEGNGDRDSGSGQTPLPEPVDVTARFRGWNGAGRPITAVYRPEHPLTRGELTTTLHRILPGTFRAKGYLPAPAGGPDWFVSAIGREFSFRGSNGEKHVLGLSIIAPADLDLQSRLREISHRRPENSNGEQRGG